MNNKKAKGDFFEKAASHYLQQQGLRLIEQQAHSKVGELDLIMQDKTCLVFVEVRFRSKANFGGAASSISITKQRKLRKAALLWMAQQGICSSHTEFRFDALTFDGDIKSVNWIQNIIIEG